MRLVAAVFFKIGWTGPFVASRDPIELVANSFTDELGNALLADGRRHACYIVRIDVEIGSLDFERRSTRAPGKLPEVGLPESCTR